MANIDICEDDPLVRETTNRILTKRKHTVRVFENGYACLAALAIPGAPLPDLLITDIRMPRLDGLELCRRLRSLYAKERLPILIVSGRGLEDEIVLGFQVGANDYIVKPFSLEVLQAKVRRLLVERAKSADADSELPTRKIGSPTVSRIELLPRPTLTDYELESEIGRGGMGVVYRAKQISTGRVVALKVLRSDQHAGCGIRRFLREAEVLSGIHHPYVVDVMDSGSEGDFHYLAMELVQGESVRERLRRSGRFPTADALSIGRQVAHALDCLHAKKLVHRDVKPANILLERDGTVKLVDFGLAKTAGLRDLTRTGEALGTPYYVAPEVISGSEPDIRADIYSLGVVLFEMLAGRKPFEGVSGFHICHEAVNGEELDVAAELPDLDPAIAKTVQRMVFREPPDRYRDPSALLEDLPSASTPETAS